MCITAPLTRAVPMGIVQGDICGRLEGRRYYLDQDKSALLYVKNLDRSSIKLRPSHAIPAFMKTASRRHRYIK